MQSTSLDYPLPRSAELIPFPETVMRGSNATKPEPTFSQKHGTTAQWIAIVFAIICSCLSPLATLYVLHSQNQSKSGDDHISGLIRAQISPLSERMGALEEKVGNIYGLMGKVASLELESNRLKSVIRLQSPDRAMRTIRTEITSARDNGERVPPPAIADFKNVLQEVSPAHPDYWTTLAAVINYQSYVNQRSGLAPNPRTISRPCFSPVFGTLSMKNSTLNGCLLTLAGTTNLDNVVFVNSVIRYEGEPISLHNVRFINCNFIIDAKFKPSSQPTKKTPPLLLALLTSPDQKSISVQ